MRRGRTGDRAIGEAFPQLHPRDCASAETRVTDRPGEVLVADRRLPDTAARERPQFP